MSFTLSVEELLRFHRDAYNPPNAHDSIRQYILENEAEVFEKILVENEASNQASDPASDPDASQPQDEDTHPRNEPNIHIHEPTSPDPQSTHPSIDLGELELDTETLRQWELNHANNSNEHQNEYVQLQHHHRQKFLQEIKQKGLTLKDDQENDQTTPDHKSSPDRKSSRDRNNPLIMNY